ncbi:MAG: JAB domain-containing protein, partial [SAR324 cluster bacterium]|nr:JAB domain-containing protein [SAR324 cluster bacterium]
MPSDSLIPEVPLATPAEAGSPSIVDAMVPQQQPAPIETWGDAFKYGWLNTLGSLKQYAADQGARFLDDPEAVLPYLGEAGLGVAMNREVLQLSSEVKAKQQTQIAEQAAQAKQWLAQRDALGRPLSWEEWEGPEGFYNYFKGLVGTSAPYTAAGMASLGALSPLLMSAEFNQSLSEIEGLPRDERLKLAETGGLIAGALEVVGLGVLVRGVPKSVLAKIGTERLANVIERNYGAKVASDFVTRGLAESATETAQTGVELATRDIGGEDITPEKAARELKESAIGGALLGGSIGTVAGRVQDVTGVVQDHRAEQAESELVDAVLGAEAEEAARIAGLGHRREDAPANLLETEKATGSRYGGEDFSLVSPAPEEMRRAAQQEVETPTPPAPPQTPEPPVDAEPELTDIEPTRPPYADAAQPLEANPAAKPGQPGYAREALPDSRREVITPVEGGRTAQVERVVVELSELTQAEGDLQTRDRDRVESEEGARTRAQHFDAAQVTDPARKSDSGPPIVLPSGVILSGNGRVLTLKQLYSDPRYAEQLKTYQSAIAADVETSGQAFQQPVVVQRLLPGMPRPEVVSFGEQSNRPSAAVKSGSERANEDAQRIPNLISHWSGGEVASLQNAEFVRQFVDAAVPQSERGAFFQSDGKAISQEGVRRIQGALLAAGYGDAEALALMLESTDDNVKSLSGAMLDAAPRYAELRALIAKGEVPAELDLAPALTAAVSKIRELRNSGKKPNEFFAQQDFTAEPNPLRDALIRAFYYEDLKKPRSKKFVTEVLNEYVADTLDQDYSEGFPGMDLASASAEETLSRAVSRTTGETDAGREDSLLPDAGADTEAGHVSAALPRYSRTEQLEFETTQLELELYVPSKTEARRDPAGTALRSVGSLRRNSGALLGNAIAKDFKDQGHTSLIGQRVQNSEDLAVLAQVYRNPSFETLRYFFMKGEVVVGQTGVSSRLPASSGVFPGKSTRWDYFSAGLDSIRDQISQVDADGFYLLHNHPTGSPDPSFEDVQVTRRLQAALPGFRGHIIIDQNKYGVIPPSGAVSTHPLSDKVLADEQRYSIHQPKIPHRLLGIKIRKDFELAAVAAELQKSGNHFLLIGRNAGGAAGGRVVGIMEVPLDLLAQPELRLVALTRKFMRQTGAASVFAVNIPHPEEASAPAFFREGRARSRLEKALRTGVLLDVLELKGGALISLNPHGDVADAEMTAGRRGLGSVRVAEETAEFGKSVNPEVGKRLKAARGRKQATIFTRAKERIGDFGKSYTRAFPKLDPKRFGAVLDNLRLMKEVPNYSHHKA